MIRWIAILALTGWVIGSPAAWAGTEEGLVAYKRGDYDKAFREFRKGARRGDAEAQYYFGRMHIAGDGVARNYAEGAKWYRKAAEKGNASAQFYLGRLYFWGQGVSQSYPEAAKWYLKAAAQGEVMAQIDLGGMYFEGLGLVQDFVLAHMWLNIASASVRFGDEDAKGLRDEIARSMTPSQIAKAQRLAQECFARDYQNC